MTPILKQFFIFFILGIVPSTLYAISENQERGMPPIVSASWLLEHIYDQDIVIIDLRTKEAFEQGHIKGAVNLPPAETLFTANKMLPSLEELTKTFGNAGISTNTRVIAYDEGKFIWAARSYWILETLGHKKVALLNVGYGNWEGVPIPTETTSSHPLPKVFIPQVDNTKLQTKLGTLVSIGNKTIIDGRQRSHYLGLESKAKHFGHIPTAQNYPCTQTYEVTQTGNKMRSLEELRFVYDHLPQNKDIILYCDGGAESALNYIVLQELGFHAAVYAGSWFEWGNDDNVPIENPSQK